MPTTTPTAAHRALPPGRFLAALAGLGMALAVTACSSGSAKSPPTRSSRAVPSVSNEGCGGLRAGQGGIIKVFCDGPARAKITIGRTAKELTGGVCLEGGPDFALNFGALAGPDYPSAKPQPDYLTALLNTNNRTVSGFSVHINGKGGDVIRQKVTFDADRKTLKLRGTLLKGGTAVAADVIC